MESDNTVIPNPAGGIAGDLSIQHPSESATPAASSTSTPTSSTIASATIATTVVDTSAIPALPHDMSTPSISDSVEQGSILASFSVHDPSGSVLMATQQQVTTVATTSVVSTTMSDIPLVPSSTLLPVSIPQVVSTALPTHPPSDPSSQPSQDMTAATASVPLSIPVPAVPTNGTDLLAAVVKDGSNDSAIGSVEGTMITDTGLEVSELDKRSTVKPWQDVLVNMISELGFFESSRMMAAEELVLSATQRENAPRIIAKYMRDLKESVLDTGISLDENTITATHGTASKRQSQSDLDVSDTDFPEGFNDVKRRRVEESLDRIEVNATRDVIQEKMAQFISSKREQINESNRQEFVKARGPSSTTITAGATEVEDDSMDTAAESLDDDGCARVDARKLNRTIQMKLETVKNEALTKTNPRTHPQADQNSMLGTNSALDERLKNIQLHLNLRFAATPACTLTERIRIIEDVIIQLEQDYPLWSALHFNQPNRVFPPPPSVTTVSRNTRNQILITGDHLSTTLLEQGDAIHANAATLTHHSPSSVSRTGPGAQAGAQWQSAASDKTGVTPRTTGENATGATTTTPGQSRAATVASSVGSAGATGGSATVIKLKRHGGAGSSSLARAVQHQLAQRKANAALAAGHGTDESKSNGPNSSGSAAHSSKAGGAGTTAANSNHSSGSRNSAVSPNIGFADPLKSGVTGRGPIKSRRKSIAKGMDPGPTIQHGNILGTNPGPGGLIASSPPGADRAQSVSIANSALSASEASLGTLPGSKAKSPTAPRKPRKKKVDESHGEDGLSASQSSVAALASAASSATVSATAMTAASRYGAGRGKGGYGLGKGKGGGRPLALGLGKGKGGAYRAELMRRAEVEEFEESDEEDEEEEEEEEEHGFQDSTARSVSAAATLASLSTAGTAQLMNNGSVSSTSTTAMSAQTRTSEGGVAKQTEAYDAQQLQQHLLLQQQLQQQQQQEQQQKEQQRTTASKSKQPAKGKKQPRKPASKPAMRKFGGKSFGGVEGESSGSSNESSEGEGSGSSGSQSDSSSSGSMSDSDPGDSD